jgi:hypothetical protein
MLHLEVAKIKLSIMELIDDDTKIQPSLDLLRACLRHNRPESSVYAEIILEYQLKSDYCALE